MIRAIAVLAVLSVAACQKTVVAPDKPCCNVGDAPLPGAPTPVAGSTVAPQESPVLFHRTSDGAHLADISALRTMTGGAPNLETTMLLMQSRSSDGNGASMTWSYVNYDLVNFPRGGRLNVNGNAVVYGTLQVGRLVMFENGREFVVYAGPPNSGGQGYRMLRILN